MGYYTSQYNALPGNIIGREQTQNKRQHIKTAYNENDVMV